MYKYTYIVLLKFYHLDCQFSLQNPNIICQNPNTSHEKLSFEFKAVQETSKILQFIDIVLGFLRCRR